MGVWYYDKNSSSQDNIFVRKCYDKPDSLQLDTVYEYVKVSPAENGKVTVSEGRIDVEDYEKRAKELYATRGIEILSYKSGESIITDTVFAELVLQTNPDITPDAKILLDKDGDELKAYLDARNITLTYPHQKLNDLFDRDPSLFRMEMKKNGVEFLLDCDDTTMQRFLDIAKVDVDVPMIKQQAMDAHIDVLIRENGTMEVKVTVEDKTYPVELSDAQKQALRDRLEQTFKEQGLPSIEESLKQAKEKLSKKKEKVYE